MNVITKSFNARRRSDCYKKPCSRGRKGLRWLVKHTIRCDRRAAKIALHIGDYEAPRSPLAMLTDRDM